MKALRILSIAASLSLGFASSLLAQDVLITQEGDAHKVYDIEIGGSSIFYKLENTPEAAIQKINKSQVLMIKYQDGRKVIMGEEEKEKEQIIEKAQQPQGLPMAFTPEEEAEIAALNAKFVEEYNQRKVEFTEPKDKRAKMLFCTFGLKKDTRLQDKNVKITLESQNYHSPSAKSPILGKYGTNAGAGILVTVKNTSSQTVYIDLGNSFFVRNGEAAPYYTPTSTSTTTGTSGGASVNLGSVVSALGVGGIAGTLASGVNVGGGKSSSSSTVTYAQRIVAIPPESEIKLEHQKYCNTKYDCSKIRITKNSIWTLENININQGEVNTFTEEDNILNYSIRIAYSLEENCQQTFKLYATTYLKEIMGVTGNNSYSIKQKHLTPNWKDVIYMVIDNR